MRKPSLLPALVLLATASGAARAQHGDHDTSAGSSGAAAAPAAASDGSGASSGSQTAAATVAEVKKDERVRFYGLAMDFSAYDGTSLNAINYSNDVAMYFMPSWAVGKLAFKGTRFERLALSARFVLNRTLVGYAMGSYAASSDNGPAQPCSNLTPSTNGGQIDPNQVQRCPYPQNHRWDYGDIWLTLGNPKIYTIPKLELNVNPSILFLLPTSLQNRYQTLRLGMTGTLGVSRAFFSGKLLVGYGFGFTKNFHRYTDSVGQGTGTNGDPLISSGYHVADALGPGTIEPFNATSPGGLNVSYGFKHQFSLDVNPTNKLGISVLYIVTDSFKYPMPNTATINGQTFDTYGVGQTIAANSGSNILQVGHSDMQWFWATVGYQLLDWLNVSVALITISPQRKPDGSVRQPFISTNYDAFSQLSFGATISIEKAAARLF